MKKLRLIVVFFFTAATLAQEITNRELPPGITIRKYKWQQAGPSPNLDSSMKAESDSPTGGSSDSEDSPGFGERRGPAFIYTLEIQNDGRKAIKAIRWSYIITDSKTNAELGTHEFENVAKVGANKVKTVTAKSRLSPTRVLPVPAADKSATTERVELKCVLFEDGTLWRWAGAAPQVCDGLRERTTN